MAKCVTEMKTIQRKGEFAYGWARTGGQTLTRTGTMSGTAAYVEYRPNGLSFVLITNTSSYRGASFTNRIGHTVREAMARVKAWPEEQDLFTSVPTASTETVEGQN